MKTVTVKTGAPTGAVISPALHSQFIEHLGSCIYGGLWVGKDSPIPNIEGFRKDILEPLSALRPPVIRWPGGCFADTYHWRDGIGKDRPVIFNGNFGTNRTEDNAFGTDEFMRLCALTGSKPWLNLNLLSGSVREAVEWAEYCNRTESTALSDMRRENGSDAPYGVEMWGIGNEVWAGGGNMTPEDYASLYRRFASAMPHFTRPDGSPLPQTYILSGPDGNKPKERVRWTRDLFKALARYRQPKLDAIDLHFYNWNVGPEADEPDGFDEKGWYRVLRGAMEIEGVILEQDALIKEGLAGFPEPEGSFFPAPEPSCKLIIGEWGNWHQSAFRAKDALWQQCSMRDAVTSALTLDIFHRQADKLSAACCAQTVNVLNALFLTDGDRTVLTPHYYVYRMYMPHRGGNLLQTASDSPEKGGLPEVMATASEKDGEMTVSLVCTGYASPLPGPVGPRAGSGNPFGRNPLGRTPHRLQHPRRPLPGYPAGKPAGGAGRREVRRHAARRVGQCDAVPGSIKPKRRIPVFWCPPLSLSKKFFLSIFWVLRTLRYQWRSRVQLRKYGR